MLVNQPQDQDYMMRSRIFFVRLPKALSWDDCDAFANNSQGRLPTLEEMQNYCATELSGQPFTHEDAWVPIQGHDWVSIGNNDLPVRYAQSYTQLFEPADRSDKLVEVGVDDGWRKWMAIVMNDGPFPPGIYFKALKAPTWKQCKEFAEYNGCRLASMGEIRVWVPKTLKGKAIADYDVWLPIRDREDDWISMGTCEMKARYMNSHIDLFGIPEWSKTNSLATHRGLIAVVRR